MDRMNTLTKTKYKTIEQQNIHTGPIGKRYQKNIYRQPHNWSDYQLVIQKMEYGTTNKYYMQYPKKWTTITTK